MSGVNHSGFSIEQINSIPDMVHHMSPSEFVEAERYLPAHVTRYPGPYRFDVNPFMREIVDCFDVRSDVREVTLMKGVQITYTTVAECVLFYAAAHLGTYPCQWLTDDDGNARKRLDKNIVPMFINSGWGHILQSNDTTNVRKQGVTRDQISWKGGGYCLAHGVQTGGKLRQDSIMFQIKDELDAWPLIVGKDGDPDKVSSDRCAAYWDVRKQFRGSTPLLMGSSKIHHQFLRGDQRHYYVKCHGCGVMQFLRWRATCKDTGVVSGIGWEMNEDGTLVQESVYYACESCGHRHFEHDKDVLFSTDHGAEWRPTATPREPGIRSYKLPALYSPVGMQPWHKSVSTWLEAWDPERNKPRNIGILQVFYNNVLAEPFEVVGERMTLETVSKHRRRSYVRGDIPNKWLQRFGSGPVGVMIMTVDVQKDWLAVGIFGMSPSERYPRTVLIDYIEIRGDTEHPEQGAWVELATMLENDEWIADDGKIYRPVMTLVDSAYRTDAVYTFCAAYSVGVFPIHGQSRVSNRAAVREFHPYVTKLGTRAFNISVDLYKDRLRMLLGRDWDGVGEMPDGLFSAPLDIKDSELKHLTVEYKRQKKNPRTGQPIGFEWHRPGNARQELWDLMVYAMCGFEILAWGLMIEELEREVVDWKEFWHIVFDQRMYYREGTAMDGVAAK